LLQPPGEILFLLPPYDLFLMLTIYLIHFVEMPVKIGLQTWGTDGDIRPFIALAGGLRAAGREVTLVVTSGDGKDYSSFGKKMDFAVIHAGTLSYDDDELSQIKKKVLNARHPLLQLDIILNNLFNPVISEMFEAANQLCKENDIILGHSLHYPAHTAAEKQVNPTNSRTQPWFNKLKTYNCLGSA
jgi:UDP:flavonoid glycosyltransferase YjiC (YdhE family)